MRPAPFLALLRFLEHIPSFLYYACISTSVNPSNNPHKMQMQQTHLQRAVYELGLLPCYQFEGKNYYDTREVL